jgi:hypothetical protein
VKNPNNGESLEDSRQRRGGNPEVRELRPNEPGGAMYRKDKLGVLEVRNFVNRNRGLIYGTMLGDASIDGRGRDARVRIRHAESQKDYVFHKYDLLKLVAASAPYPEIWVSGTVWSFCTSTSEEWQRVWSTFHQNSPAQIRVLPNGKTVRFCRKVVTEQILRDLDDHGLALWIMDDGNFDVHYNKRRRCYAKRLTLSTDGYSVEENELILRWFLERYGVVGRKSRNRYRLKDGSTKTSCRIRISWTGYQKLIPRIEKFFIPSMRYKLEPPQDKGIPTTRGNMTRSGLAGDRESQPEMVDRLVNSQVCTAENGSVGK